MSTPFLVGLVGARGFTGRELIRFIAGHPELMLAYAVSREWAGRPVADIAPEDKDECVFEALTPEEAAKRRADVVILALPDGAAADYVAAHPEVSTRRRYAACDWVAYTEEQAHYQTMLWLSERLAGKRPALRASSTLLIRDAVAAGAGLGLLPCYLGDATPTLRRVAGPVARIAADYWMIVPRELARLPRVRRAIDWVVASFAVPRSRALFASVSGVLVGGLVFVVLLVAFLGLSSVTDRPVDLPPQLFLVALVPIGLDWHLVSRLRARVLAMGFAVIVLIGLDGSDAWATSDGGALVAGLVWFAVTLGALVALAAVPPAAADAGADAAAIRANAAAWASAYNAGDADKIVAMYWDDAVLLPPGAPAASGHDAIRAFMG